MGRSSSCLSFMNEFWLSGLRGTGLTHQGLDSISATKCKTSYRRLLALSSLFFLFMWTVHVEFYGLKVKEKVWNCSKTTVHLFGSSSHLQQKCKTKVVVNKVTVNSFMTKNIDSLRFLTLLNFGLASTWSTLNTSYCIGQHLTRVTSPQVYFL